MKKTKSLIIIGTSAFAEVAYEYFQHDSEYEIVAFSVEEAYITDTTKYALPVVPFEQLETLYSPKDHYFFVALVYKQLNRIRTRLYQQAKSKGYQPASYISSRAFVWRNVTLGEHCFIMENNVIQPFVTVGNNVIFWSGNHIGHHSVIQDNCFISSHVVLSGFCTVGRNCFLAVNCTIADRVIMGDDCFINSGAIVMKSIGEGTIVNPIKSDKASISSLQLFKV